MAGLLRRGIEAVSHVETIHTILQTEFVRTLLAPSISAMLTGTAGILGGVPVMYVMVAAALAFAAVAQGALRASEYRERKSPLNKLRYNGTIFNFDLVSVTTNRKARRTHVAVNTRTKLPSTVEPLVRELENGQLGVELVNFANFPISLIVHSADTEIEEFTPPRTQYPRPAITVLPGIPIRVCDTSIPLKGTKCDKLEGKINLKIKYGLPGKEVYDLDIETKRVDVLMHANGFCSATYTVWREADL